MLKQLFFLLLPVSLLLSSTVSANSPTWWEQLRELTPNSFHYFSTSQENDILVLDDDDLQWSFFHNGLTFVDETSRNEWQSAEDIIGQWEPGDVIMITTNFAGLIRNDYPYVLTNQAKKQQIMAQIVRTSRKLRIAYIERDDFYDDKIILNDGSVWALSTRVGNWKVGDSIVIGTNHYYTNDYDVRGASYGYATMIINVNKGNSRYVARSFL